MPDTIVEEELALLAQVGRALAAADERPTPSEAGLIDELEHIRDQLVRGGPDFYDQSALATRWSVQSALLAQLRRSRSAPQVDPASPYFAHMRLRESGRLRDVCLGRATRLDNGLRIVDWRHARGSSTRTRPRRTAGGARPAARIGSRAGKSRRCASTTRPTAARAGSAPTRPAPRSGPTSACPTSRA
jgi:hypothetical protein